MSDAEIRALLKDALESELAKDALAECRRKALEEAEKAVRDVRESHERDAGDCRDGGGCDFIIAWETAEERIRNLRGIAVSKNLLGGKMMETINVGGRIYVAEEDMRLTVEAALATNEDRNKRIEQLERELAAVKKRHEAANSEVFCLAELLRKADPKWGSPMHLNATHVAPQPEGVPQGWKLVPLEPTQEMIDTAASRYYDDLVDIPTMLRDVIASAPEYPPSSQPGAQQEDV